MKMSFQIVISGDDIIEKKFEAALKENPDVSMYLIKGFAHVLALALRLKHEDTWSVESFKAGKINEELSEPEKKIDN